MTAIPTWSCNIPAAQTAYWHYTNSPTTQRIGNPPPGDADRIVCWDTGGGMPSALYSGHEMWMLCGLRLVTGKPKRMMNLHNQPNDAPYGYNPLTRPPASGGVITGVSPVAIDYPAGTIGNFVLALYPEQGSSGQSGGTGYYEIFSVAEAEARRGQWIWIWLWIRWGRSDAAVDGAAKLWVAGEDNSPRINLTNINTHWYGQHQITFWQGGYWANNTNPSLCVVEHAFARFGRTPQECYEDVPVRSGGGSFVQTGAGGTCTSTQITSRQHDEAAIPADIVWSGGGITPPTPLATNTRQRRFGKTAPGAERSTLTGNFKRGSKFGTNLNPNDEYADVYDMHIYLEGYDGNVGSQNVTLGIYDDDAASNGPGTKFGEISQEISLTGNATGGWQKVTTATPIRINGQYVWLVAGSGLPTGRLAIASDASVTNGLAANADTYDASAPRLASPFGSINYSDNEMTICADYDVVVPDTPDPERPPTGRTTAIARVAGTKVPGLGGGGI